MNNLSSYCGLVDAKIRASDKDLLMHILYLNAFSAVLCPKTDAATVDATAPMACFEPFE